MKSGPARSGGKRLLRLGAREDGPRADDRPAGREPIVESELLDDLEGVRHCERDLHQAHARLAHCPSRLARDQGTARADDRHEPILTEDPYEVPAHSERPLSDGHRPDGT
jgi:hypothetical protein